MHGYEDSPDNTKLYFSQLATSITAAIKFLRIFIRIWT